MPWESGTGAPAPATTAAAVSASSPPPQAAASSPPPPQAAAPAAGGAPSALADELMKSGRKWGRSSVAAENNYRRKKGMPLLTDADAAYLIGEEAPAAAAPAATASPAASPAAAAARPAAVATAALPLRRDGEAVKYVGTPAVGTSQAAAAGGVGTAGPTHSEINIRRRRLAWTAVAAFLATWLIAFFRFFLP
ncbi:MAG TPA: hypothetical protein VG892_09125, partial [Terriglobales bacterium]|nr:hypothetical protein [Terriglobales bacterium]